ncbi:hypothetical protein HELRODRAFT_146503, partial [Helobdella robusta]|uniref:RGS domain-containing protein n=1 Tax=Helobdella robusta TaxID=6412 RepID=T1EJS7_HELRO
DELEGWRSSFERIMRSHTGRQVFRGYLKSEYSEENMLFWLAIEDYRKVKDCRTREEKARIIYEDYISILSPKEVSLDSRVREVINAQMVNPTKEIFDDAQLQIFTLMQRDSYPRFLNSQLFKSL